MTETLPSNIDTQRAAIEPGISVRDLEIEALNAYREYSQRVKHAGGSEPLEFSDWRQRLYVPQEVQSQPDLSSSRVREAVAQTLDQHLVVPPSEDSTTSNIAAKNSSIIRSGQYIVADGSARLFDVVRSDDGIERMVERPVGEANDHLDGSTSIEPAPPVAPAQELKPLTSEQQAIQAQRDQWKINFPGKAYLTPEGPTLGLDDISRLKAEADAYGLANYKRTEVAELYQSVMQTGSERESTLRTKIEAEFPGRDPNEITALIQKKKDQAMKAKRQEIIDQRLPYPQDARRRDIKKVNKQREQLILILTKSPDEFAQLNTDWQGYEDIIHTDEIASLQVEANEIDKSLRSNTEKARLRERLDELDQQNGGALEHLSQYELEKDQPTATIIQDYKNRLVKHKDDEDLQDVDHMFAFRDLKLRLSEVISSGSPSLTDAEVSQRTEAATSHLVDWVDSMAENENDPLKDLSEYKNQQRAYENWDRRRRQAVEHLAPVVLARLIQRRFLEVAEKATEIPVAGKIIDRILDSRKIGANNGAHMLRRGDQLSETNSRIYKAGVMGQLELAREYGRHSGNLLKTALVLDSLARSGVDQISPVIDRLPDAERRKVIRKKMYGKAAVLAALSRRSAKKAANRLKAEAKFVGQQFNIIEEDRWNAGR